MPSPRVRSRTGFSDRIVMRFRSRLLPSVVRESDGYQTALKYAVHQRGYRLGRNVVTDPFVFNRAFRAADRAARVAQERFHSSVFRAAFGLLPARMKERVLGEYRTILKTAAALRRIQARDLVQHHQTPSVYDKRAFTALLRESLRNGLRKPFTLAMVDLDDFKQVNSLFGHGVGDVVLDHFSNALSRFAKNHGGFVGRVGGEEFQIYLPIPPEQTQKWLDTFRNTFRNDTHRADFIRRSGVPVIGDIDQWNKGVSFTVGMTGARELHQNIRELKSLFSLVQRGLKEGKSREGKGTSIVIDLPRQV
ncbi:MAG: GGDEF domain-containing protein [Candidatus Diapherotrites archaeon]|uniref:GGDEF domain-containing protein n=1 Tax=Candidatus Iainarchaeum sp. TaxID=3101447 RepID=A0A8T4C7P4_9ARCH|nr:GGDEF domain-containing protein [Candidatus Diapherotrites archaeon]